MEPENIPGLFGVSGKCTFEELRNGHINRTFLCSCGDEKYVLQNIDREVFPSPENIESNIRKITAAFENAGEERVTVPAFLISGEKYHAEQGGEIWRMYPYIPQKISPLTNRSWSCGLAFGTFIRVLSAKPVRLRPAGSTLHDCGRTFFSLSAMAGNSVNKRIDSTVISKLGSLKDTLEQVFTADFPKRNVHNDTKADNVIIGEKLAVIDLDTAMSGYAALDYGDMIRSLSGVTADMTVIRDATRGFAAGLEGTLTSDEVDSLYYGILYATGELAMRYLIDYISEAGYFKGKTPADCLARANSLLGQLNRFINSGDELTDIINSAFGR